jgi:hypothetical protein
MERRTPVHRGDLSLLERRTLFQGLLLISFGTITRTHNDNDQVFVAEHKMMWWISFR